VTIANELAMTLSSIEGAAADLKSFSLQTQDQQAKQMFQQLANTMDHAVQQLKGRLDYVMQEEPQYRNEIGGTYNMSTWTQGGGAQTGQGTGGFGTTTGTGGGMNMGGMGGTMGGTTLGGKTMASSNINQGTSGINSMGGYTMGSTTMSQGATGSATGATGSTNTGEGSTFGNSTMLTNPTQPTTGTGNKNSGSKLRQPKNSK